MKIDAQQFDRIRNAQTAEPLRTLCAWCGVLMHEGRLPVSHGCCERCVAKHFPLSTKEHA